MQEQTVSRKNLFRAWATFTAVFIAASYLFMGFKEILIGLDPYWPKNMDSYFPHPRWSTDWVGCIFMGILYGLLLLVFHRLLRSGQKGSVWLAGFLAATVVLWPSLQFYIEFNLQIKPHLPPMPPLSHGAWVNSWLLFLFNTVKMVFVTAATAVAAASAFRHTPHRDGTQVLPLSA